MYKNKIHSSYTMLPPQIKRKRKVAVQQVDEGLTLLRPPVLSESKRSKLTGIPITGSIGEIHHFFGVLNAGTTSSSSSSSSSEPGSTTGPALTFTDFQNASSSADFLYQEFIRLRVKLEQMTPTYHENGKIFSQQTNNEECIKFADRIVIPWSNAEIENQTLVAAGSWADESQPGLIWEFLPCLYDQECVGVVYFRRINGLTEPVVLASHVLDDEWPDFVKHHKQPSVRRPCVLCHRYYIHLYLHFVRDQLVPCNAIVKAMKQEPGLISNTTSSSTIDRYAASLQAEFENPYEVCQLWTNSFDEEGGYHRIYQLKPNPCEIIIAPMMEHSFQFLRAYRNPNRQGQWTIDQSTYLYHKQAVNRMVEPRIGELVRDFSKGAN
jgi:hypothetical protein